MDVPRREACSVQTGGRAQDSCSVSDSCWYGPLAARPWTDPHSQDLMSNNHRTWYTMGSTFGSFMFLLKFRIAYKLPGNIYAMEKMSLSPLKKREKDQNGELSHKTLEKISRESCFPSAVALPDDGHAKQQGPTSECSC